MSYYDWKTCHFFVKLLKSGIDFFFLTRMPLLGHKIEYKCE